MQYTKKNIVFGLFALLLGACTEAPKEAKIGPVNDLYNSGVSALDENDFANAVHAFEELERQHPYSGWATRAQMMTAFAHYKAGNYAEAIAASERFIRLHPGHRDLPYLYYLRAMSFYVQISDVKRDQGYTRQALESFEEIVRRFPDSMYARDARFKATLCRDHLAGKEMDVGRYYLKQRRYLAAVNRFREVIRNYETSTHTPEALYRMTEAYLALGVNDEAKRNAAILGHNYPDSDWYADAYDLLTAAKLAPAGQAKAWSHQLLKGLEELF
jgi:outer membrane protein assembly factor BamD